MFEKFLSKLLFTTVGYGIIAILGFLVFSLVAAGLTRIFFGVSDKIFNPFQPGVYRKGFAVLFQDVTASGYGTGRCETLF